METVHDSLVGGLRVLLLEDSERDAEMIRYALQAEIPELILERVDTRETFARALETFSPQIVLADYLVPGLDGHSALKLVRTGYPDLPFLFVSGSLGEELAVELLRAGATDYILKDRMSRLPSAVMRSLEDARERMLLAERTVELREKTVQLAEEVEVRREAEEALLASQKDLRQLALELSMKSDRELRRIALEIHDRIGQNLVLVLMNLESLKNKHQDLEELDHSAALLDRTIQQMRSLALEMSPPVLYEFGIFAALEWLAERLKATDGVSITLKLGSQHPLPSMDLQVLLYNTVREMIHNTLRHGTARNILVQSGIAPEGIYAEIENEGSGFETSILDKMEETGLGLFSIRERLNHLGGRLSIEPNSRSGSRLRITLPANASI